MGPYASELAAKSIGFILLQDDERKKFAALTRAQKAYFLHWCRSNSRRSDIWSTGIRKATGQRP